MDKEASNGLGKSVNRVMVPSSHSRSTKLTLSLLDQWHHLTADIKPAHAHLIVTGAIADPFAAGKLASLFALSPSAPLSHLLHILRTLPHPPTLFFFNTTIRAHADRRLPLAAFSLYNHLLAATPLRPNNYTFSFLLRSALHLRSLPAGQALHAHVVRLGWAPHEFVQNGLIHLYAACGAVPSARNVFDESSHRDVISWTAIIHGYAKTGHINTARELFDKMPERNSVSWSAMITAYSQVGMFRQALDLFNEMQLDGIRPNHAGIVGALSACGFLGALEQGKWIHAFAERSRIGLDSVLGTALVDMYGKCGCIENAWQVFDEMPERDVFAYTAMISGLSNHGHSEEAVGLFGKMQEEGVRPNEVTFICVISACARMGLVSQGREFFENMDGVYGIKPGVEHYGCLVDLLGRAGLLEEAKRVVMEMPMEPDSYVLGALLNACRERGEVGLGKETVESLMELGLDGSGVHVLMSNMYASASKWDDVIKVRRGMEEKKVRKVPGCSMIEVDGMLWEFIAGDRSHLFMEEIIFALKGLDKQLRSLGNNVYTVENYDGFD